MEKSRSTYTNNVVGGLTTIAIVVGIILFVFIPLVTRFHSRPRDSFEPVALNAPLNSGAVQQSYTPIIIQAHQNGSYGQIPVYPARHFQNNGLGLHRQAHIQLVAGRSNSLTLPMGVTLVGKGTVTSVVPGSKAERAGIRIGDLINRINGK